jgi:lysophospholipase L1-like esterase
VRECYEDVFVNGYQAFAPDYDQFGPIVGSHCLGTNHQEISGIERVVFLGDSVTVGSPPTLPRDMYRSKLADALVARYGLMFGSGLGDGEQLWKAFDPFNGTAAARDSGAFSSCAEWGARNDDLLRDGTQIEDCFPPERREERTLVVMTSGGNDVANLTQNAIDGVPMEMLWDQVFEMVELKRTAVSWFLDDPLKFPNGVFIVFANVYEFTDGTGDVMTCDVSGLAGFDMPVPQPDELVELVVYLNEQYMDIAVDTQTDMVFMLEEFCGRGFAKDDPAAPCYRGPGQEPWFDLTCIHPNPTGHGELASMFDAVIAE